jgi:hypothetical protein
MCVAINKTLGTTVFKGLSLIETFHSHCSFVLSLEHLSTKISARKSNFTHISYLIIMLRTKYESFILDLVQRHMFLKDMNGELINYYLFLSET